MDSDSPRSTVRRQVRAERERRGWSQSDLAKAAGVSRGTIANLEGGMHLTEGKEAKVEAALGKPLGWLDDVRAGRAETDRPTEVARPEAQSETPTLGDLQREYVYFMGRLDQADMQRLFRLLDMYHELQVRESSTQGGVDNAAHS